MTQIQKVFFLFYQTFSACLNSLIQIGYWNKDFKNIFHINILISLFVAILWFGDLFDYYLF